MNYRKLSMIVLLVGICALCLPVPVSAGGDVNIQNYFSGPVLVTAGSQFTVCATNVSGGPKGPNGTMKILIGLLSDFAIRKGLFSHWQVWFAFAGLLQTGSYLLNRYGRTSSKGTRST